MFMRQSRTTVVAAAAVVASVCFPSVAANCRNISAPPSGECTHLTCEFNEYCSIIGANNEIASCCSCRECQGDETMTTPCYWKGQNAECTQCSMVCGQEEYGDGRCEPGSQRYDATNQVLMYVGVKVPTCVTCDNATCPDGMIRSGMCGGELDYKQNDYSCAIAAVGAAPGVASKDVYVYVFYGIVTGGFLLFSGIYIFMNSDQPNKEVVKKIRAIQKGRPVLNSKTDATDEWQSTYDGEYFEKKEADNKEKYPETERSDADWTPPEPPEPPQKEVVTAETNFGLSTNTTAWGFSAPEKGTILMDPEAPEDKAATLIGGDELDAFADGTDQDSYGHF